MENWATSHFKPSDNDKTVSQITLCGYTNENNEGDGTGRSPTNHWVAVLQLSEGGSVKLDVLPGDGPEGLTATIILDSSSSSSSSSSSRTETPTDDDDNDDVIKTWSSGPLLLGPWTVREILSLILANGRDKYEFTVHEEGCRYWMLTFVGDLEGAGIVAGGSAREAEGVLSRYWRFPSGDDLRMIEVGTFF